VLNPVVNIFTIKYVQTNFNQLGTNRLWGEGIKVCSNEGECPSLRGDNSKRMKNVKIFTQIFFSRTSRPLSVIFCTNHL
jgi:hypothetical protein